MKYKVRVKYPVEHYNYQVVEVEISEEEVKEAKLVDEFELGYKLSENVDVSKLEHTGVSPESVIVYDWVEVE